MDELIDTGVFRTHYVRAGERGRPVVMLLHDGAWGADAMVSWAQVIDDLAADFDVIAPDLLGFGQSDKVVFLDRSPYDARLLQIRLLCEALDTPAPHMVGTSFGGSVVLRAAAASTWRMRSATSFAGTGGPWRRDIGMKVLNSFEPGIEYLRTVVALLTNDASGLEQNALDRHANVLRPGHYAAMVAPGLRNPEQAARTVDDSFPASLAGARCPVTVVESSDDQVCEAGWTDHIVAAVPHVKALRMRGPHSPNLVDPSAVSGIIRHIVNDAELNRKENQ